MKRLGLLFLTLSFGLDSVQAASRHTLGDKMLIVGTATLPLTLLSVVTYKKAKAKLIKLREQAAAQNKDQTTVTLGAGNVPQEKPAVVVPEVPSNGAILREMCKDPSYVICSSGLLAFIAFVLALPIKNQNSSGHGNYRYQRYPNYTGQQQYYGQYQNYGQHQAWDDLDDQDDQQVEQQGPKCLCDETENLRCAANCQDTATHLFCVGCYAQLRNENCSWCDMTHLNPGPQPEPQEPALVMPVQEPILQAPAKPVPVQPDAVKEIAWVDVAASSESGECPSCYEEFASGEQVLVCAHNKKHMWHAQCEGLQAYAKTDCMHCRHSVIELHKVAQKTN